MRFFRGTQSREVSDRNIDVWRAEMVERGWINWAVEVVKSGTFVGFIGLSVPKRALPFMPCVEVGYRLAQEYWGQGYATEGAQAALDVGFKKLGLEQIVSFTAIVNLPSRAEMLPEKRLAELMADLFGVRLTTATIAAMGRACAVRFQGFVTAVRDLVAAAAVKHLDETGLRIGGKTQWLHIASTILLTFYRVSPKRGSMPENLTGIAVHDHWKPYYTLTGILHALCNAHHLRELKALVVVETEDSARKMQRMLRRACHAANLARQRGRPLPSRLIARFERCYDAILTEGLAFHTAQPTLRRAGPTGRGRKPRRVGHNLLLRLSVRKPDVLRFLSDLTVPFTNNIAERDGRLMKLRQKISGGFRSIAGAADFSVVRSLLSTAKKQRWNMLQTLTAEPTRLIADLRVV